MSSSIPDSAQKLNSLSAIHKALHNLTEALSEQEYRNQFDRRISPIGWHVYHMLFIENFFLHETAIGNAKFSDHLKPVCLPENIAKSDRGDALPPLKSLLKILAKQNRTNLELLSNPPSSLKSHPLMQNDYLLLFLMQHHAMHIETICMALTKRSIKKHYSEFTPHLRLMPADILRDRVDFEAGNYTIGTDAATGFDNEKPMHAKLMQKFSVNRTEVSNAEFLKFMHDGGYEDSSLWSPSGWDWLQANPVRAPYHWRQSHCGDWFGINQCGPYTLQPNEAAYGLNYYEAEAFAKWARARLPHEHEVEVALTSALKGGDSLKPPSVWEWCCNAFYPYPGFLCFPYKRYSETWFDQQHITLKGNSCYTAPILRRASFRNFYTPENRHVFAGIRLAFAD